MRDVLYEEIGTEIDYRTEKSELKAARKLPECGNEFKTECGGLAEPEIDRRKPQKRLAEMQNTDIEKTKGEKPAIPFKTRPPEPPEIPQNPRKIKLYSAAKEIEVMFYRSSEACPGVLHWNWVFGWLVGIHRPLRLLRHCQDS